MSLRHHLITTALCASCLMASGGYLARSFNLEPARANVQATNTACNWYTCKRKPKQIRPADKSALAMRISAITNERMQ